MEPLVARSSSYDVFISFRGEDTRNTFVGHLYRALKDRGIHAFVDSKDLWKGEDIEPVLLRAIKGSKLSIAVFSERYAESNWCLRELSQMLECHRTNGQIIFPVFFNIKPSDVKNQIGCFEISPQRHGKEAPQTLQRWKDTLRAIGDKSGWVFDNGDQSELVSLVVQRVWIRLNMVPPIGVKHPVALESRKDSVLSLLSKTNSSDVHFLGICGMGGLGKTTIATAVYNCIFEYFSKSCFLENIREQASQPNGLVCLQEKLLYSIFREKTEICSSREGSRLIKERLHKIDTLLILDDVENRNQLDALAGDLNWFGHGSKIIITTRDRNVLSGVAESNRKLYEPEELNKEESLRLFSSYAFSTDQPPDDYMQLSVDIVDTTGGLPLALEVLGSELSMKKDKEVWKSMHRILKQIPHNDVYGKLKISYDNLQDDIEKAMFLDAACFFIGWEKETVISIWEACGFEARYRIQVLERKSLLKITGSNELWIHDQIRDMGMRIAYNRRPMEPDKYTRLWSRNVIMKVLNGCKGNEMVEGLLLNFRSNDNTCLNTRVFEKMPKLRLLQVDGATLEGSFQCLPSGLRWLRWSYCPLKKLPANFYHDELVMLDLTFGKFRQTWNNWFETKVFQQLKVLKLSYCLNMSESPNFSKFPCLERLYLDNCTKLVNLHKSIGQLHHLIYLNLEGCYSLKKLPNSICRLSSLQKLILTNCISLKELPRSIGDLKESLVELSLDYSNIGLYPSVGLFNKLEVFDLPHFPAQVLDLPWLLENMKSLSYIDFSRFSNKVLQHCIPKIPSSFELRDFWEGNLCQSILVHMQNNMKMLELLCLENFRVKSEQFRGFVEKSSSEFRELCKVHPSRMVKIHSWLSGLTHSQGIYLPGNCEVWRQSCEYLIHGNKNRSTLLIQVTYPILRRRLEEDVNILTENVLPVGRGHHDPTADDEYGHECEIRCTVTELSLFVIKDQGPKLETFHNQSITAAPEQEEENTNKMGGHREKVERVDHI
ncbi:disease resistance protein RPV1-like [Macadamia integrifolia]|uniref:disease resistance protein RPV1-like n=1 Tax=Macadamia integrifolia TaxID=60698 RepID=UPI001C4F791E|nr:disease resistance protein RPV1-like [Macadamia integrifolia]XP_042488082.1 disease resistance protein RPV1-like [Macadamia integrifolia]XP_042488085.1 disease resistance protein RPV1-like [Macadamia integrifolia]XP_042488086.1 disease resistance protein RPV1-like [Macadamia integrifolia]